MPERRSIGIGVIGFGWMGQAHSRSYRRIPTLFPERTFEPRLVVCADNVAARCDEATSSFGFEEAGDDWRRVDRAPRHRGRHRDGAEHAPRAAVRRRRRGRQAPVLREAGRRHARADGAHRRGDAAGRHRHRRRVQLPLRAARDARPHADRVRAARRDHQLPRAVLLDVRQRPDGSAVVALPPGRGRLRRVERHPQPCRRPRPPAGRPDQRGRRDPRDVHPPAPAAERRRHALLARQPGRSDRRGDQRGLQPGRSCASRAAPVGSFESSRSMVGPESQMAFEVYGTKGALAWNLEQLNELRVHLVDDDLARRVASRRCTAAIATRSTATSCPATATPSASRTSSRSRTTRSSTRWRGASSTNPASTRRSPTSPSRRRGCARATAGGGRT